MISSRDCSFEGSRGLPRPDSSDPLGKPPRSLHAITVLNEKYFRRIHLLVEDHRDGPNGPLRGEEIAQHACQPGWKALPQRQRDPVKNGVSFDEVGKPRKQRCVPPLNLETAPLYPFQGASRRPPCVYLARELTTEDDLSGHAGLYDARRRRAGCFAGVGSRSTLVGGGAFASAFRPRLALSVATRAEPRPRRVGSPDRRSSVRSPSGAASDTRPRTALAGTRSRRAR
jgi:hypothetical protein